MGRHSKYKTPEEQLKASRARRMRSYYKHRDEINAQRRRVYRRYHSNNEEVHDACDSTPCSTSIPMLTYQAFQHLVGNSPGRVIDSLCQEYFTAPESGSLDQLLLNLEPLLTAARHREATSLQQDGIGPRFWGFQVETKAVVDFMQAVEEVLCSVMVGDLECRYKAGSLKFQLS
ncbi:hypothetical protein BDN72DRAFT_898214 [Pluteus cervinus]|uniref:Uncharacterized protein n=1 Tax=Pluteus cervinus TaxID=181527 RepID=A0ACD3ARV3_9AGAR|nr:hypothetical protein BDN72DRAFT_898214 [Pluteus cervinus]